MAHFLSLPIELRHEIYDLCLVTTQELLLEPMGWEEFIANKATIKSEETRETSAWMFGTDLDTFWPRNGLALNLLRVSKDVHAEAAPVFYGRNRFRLPLFPSSDPTSVFKKYSSLFRHIAVHYDCRDNLEERPRLLQEARHAVKDERNAMSISDENKVYIQYFDSQCIEALFRIWARKKKTRFAMTSLQTVVIDLRWVEEPSRSHSSRLSITAHHDFFRRILNYWHHPVGYDAQSALPTVIARIATTRILQPTYVSLD